MKTGMKRTPCVIDIIPVASPSPDAWKILVNKPVNPLKTDEIS